MLKVPKRLVIKMFFIVSFLKLSEPCQFYDQKLKPNLIRAQSNLLSSASALDEITKLKNWLNYSNQKLVQKNRTCLCNWYQSNPVENYEKRCSCASQENSNKTWEKHVILQGLLFCMCLHSYDSSRKIFLVQLILLLILIPCSSH